MKTMKWLLRREFWEHKGSMFWAPLVVAAIMFATVSVTLVYGIAAKGLKVTMAGQQLHGRSYLDAMPMDLRTDFVNMLTTTYMGNAVPLFLLLSFVVFWYCLGALYDERRDRSILFWKSLPASDEMTVLSKVVTAACVTPLITIAVATALSFAILLLTCAAIAFAGLNLFGAVLASPSVYLSPLALLSVLPVYVVWAMPTIGWLLLVSSWARSKVLLWAVGVPLIALAISKWISYLAIFMSSDVDPYLAVRTVVGRLLAGVIPGSWFVFQEAPHPFMHAHGKMGLDISAAVTHSWATLGTPDALVGAVLGAAMIYGAMRIRRYRDEG